MVEDAYIYNPTLSRSATVEFYFYHGYNHDVHLCYQYANETARPTGTVMHLYSVSFEPAVWRPFYGLPFAVSGVDIRTPFENDVIVRWIPSDDECKNYVGGDNLNGLTSTTFLQEGELVACVSFSPSIALEPVDYYEHHVVMYNQFRIELEPEVRVIANKQFVVHVLSDHVDSIELIWWRNAEGETTDKMPLYDERAPFTIPTPGQWWMVVQYYFEEPADYQLDPTLNRVVAEMNGLDVLYWIKDMTIPSAQSIKTTTLEVRGANMENNDLIAFLPDCSMECSEAADSNIYSMIADETDETRMLVSQPVATDLLTEETCVCELRCQQLDEVCRSEAARACRLHGG